MKLRDQTHTDNFLSAFQLNSCSCLQEQELSKGCEYRFFK